MSHLLSHALSDQQKQETGSRIIVKTLSGKSSLFLPLTPSCIHVPISRAETYVVLDIAQDRGEDSQQANDQNNIQKVVAAHGLVRGPAQAIILPPHLLLHSLLTNRAWLVLYCNEEERG